MANDLVVTHDAASLRDTSSTHTNCAMWRVVTLSVALLMWAAAGCSHVETRNPGGPPPKETFKVVEGELLRIEGQVYVVRDFEGQEVRFSVTKGTGMEKTPKIGETIGAEVDQNGLAWWVWKIK